MAKLYYRIVQNQSVGTKASGKYFPFAKSLETLDTRAMAEHIAQHGSVFTTDVVFGVLEKFRTCLIEMLLESKKVKVDGLGTFYCTIENQPGGSDTLEDFNVREHITALHIRFLPEQEQELNLSSRQFIKKASFVNVAGLLPATDEDEEENPEP